MLPGTVTEDRCGSNQAEMQKNTHTRIHLHIYTHMLTHVVDKIAIFLPHQSCERESERKREEGSQSCKSEAGVVSGSSLFSGNRRSARSARLSCPGGTTLVENNPSLLSGGRLYVKLRGFSLEFLQM